MALNYRLASDAVIASETNIYGRLKFQKLFYLLDQIGLDSGADYFYHHYGPYSEDVSGAIMDSKLFGMLEEITEFRNSDGAPYSVFQSTKKARISNSSPFGEEKIAKHLKNLNGKNATLLEIAATIHWLETKEEVLDWKSELKSRKPSKSTDERITAALALLDELGLAPN